MASGYYLWDKIGKERCDQIRCYSRGKNNKDNKWIPYELAGTGFPMIQASNFDGKRICARKMKLAFKDVKHVDSNGQCDSGFKACTGDGKISTEN